MLINLYFTCKFSAALILSPGKICVLEIFLPFNCTGLEIINGPESKCYDGYSVTRCHSTDEMINSSNVSYNSDDKLVFSKEGNRAFSLVKTRLIRIGSFLPSVVMQITLYLNKWMCDWPHASGHQIKSSAGQMTL